MSVNISDLRVEHYFHALGIAESHPRLSWRFAGDVRDWTQNAYEIRITPSSSSVGSNSHRSPDDGIHEQTRTYRITSSCSVLVPWPSDAPDLLPRQAVEVQVRALGDVDGTGENTPWSAPLFIERGIEEQDWEAEWITCEPQPSDRPRRPYRLRKTFQLPPPTSSLSNGPRVRLRITALGLYTVYLNGRLCSPDLLAPQWTEYRTHVRYQTYDLTPFLLPSDHAGVGSGESGNENVLSAWVGEGWYAGRFGVRDGERNIYGERPALLAQLEVDGKVWLKTDQTWRWKYGARVRSELYDGEEYDTRQEDGWLGGGTEHPTFSDQPSPTSSSPAGGTSAKAFDASTWLPVQIIKPSRLGKLVIPQSPPIRQVATITPIEIITTPSGATVLDFGQNMAGVVRFLSTPPAGTVVLRHAEVLEHGELCTRPLRDAKATDTIVVSPSADMRGYQPMFTFHGFRYVEVTGWPGISLGDVQGVVMQSAMERTGTFRCSHTLINKLHENVVWSTVGNTIGLPTDCPQRNERLGWTGDIQVFGPTMAFLFDCSAFLNEWLEDAQANTEENDGIVPVIVPNLYQALQPGRFNRTGDQLGQAHAIWGDVMVLTPLDLFAAFGDKDALRTQLVGAEMWLDQGVRRDRHTGLWARNQFQLADWLAPKADPAIPGLGPTDNYLVADAYLIGTTKAAARLCRLLDEGGGDGQEHTFKAEEYERQAESMLAHYYAEYVTPNGRVLSDTQTALALMLHFELYPPPSPPSVAASASASSRSVSQIQTDPEIDARSNASTPTPAKAWRARLSTRLGQLVTQDLWQVTTGFAGTPLILPVLAAHGMLHQAYRMLQARDCPSWLSPVLLGATTVWERWDSMLADGSVNPGNMTSFNHYALGAVAGFLHGVVGGLTPLEEGWKKVLVRPQPGGTIRWAEVEHKGPYGKIWVKWEIVSVSVSVAQEEAQAGRAASANAPEEQEMFELQVSIPPNTTARIVLPGPEGERTVEEVGSGRRTWKVKWNRDERFPPEPVQPGFCRPVPNNWVP